MYGLKRTFFILLSIVPALTSLANATIETFEFSGTLHNVCDHASARKELDKGTEFKGSYWFDTEKLKSIQNSLSRGNSFVNTLFEGDHDAFGMTLSVGDRTFISGDSRDAQITSSSRKKQESFSVCAYGDSSKLASMEYVTLSFSGKDGALNLQSDPLLLGGVELGNKKVSGTLTYAMYNDDIGGKGKGNMSSYTYLQGDVGSFVHTSGGGAVPEPGTLAILFLGGGAILFRRVRKKRAAVQV